MFTERRKRRELQRQLQAINDKYKPLFKAAKDPDESHWLHEEYDFEVGDVRVPLEWPETLRLTKQAEKFGIDLPAFDDFLFWDQIPHTGVHLLTESALSKLNREITDARFAYWKRWIDVLSPVLSVIIALLALVISGIALYLQLSRPATP